MLKELLIAALTLVVSFGVRAFFTWINVPIDEATFNAIVAGLVTALVALLGLNVARAILAKAANGKYAHLLADKK